MPLLINNTLEQIIPYLLAKHPNATADWLHTAIEKDYRKYSRRAIYKELSKLEDDGVIFKLGKQYNLRLAWVLDLLSFADALGDKYLNPSCLAPLLINADEKIRWKFSNLKRLDMGWTQLILALAQLFPNKVMCEWCPHQWFHLAHPHKQTQFLQACDISGLKRFHIIGGRTYLDKMGTKELPKTSTFSFAESEFEQKRHIYYSVVADFVITVRLSKKTAQGMDSLFEKMSNQRLVDRRALDTFFSATSQCSLTVERNEKKAHRLRKYFSEFFGLPVNG